MLATNSNYNQRIESGKKIEHKILDQLRQKGYNILAPTNAEDMIQKIDGWWVDKKGNKHPVQIKFRETGDDIIFELIKDIDKKIEGRDMKSQASLYIVADRNGVTRMFNTSEIKSQARKLVDLFKIDNQNNPFKTRWSGSKWEMKLQIDHGGGQRKLVAYFDPSGFSTLATWNLSLYE